MAHSGQQVPPAPEPLAPAESAYLHWAEELATAGASPTALRSALVRLCTGPDGPEAALHRLADAVLAQDLSLGLEDLDALGLTERDGVATPGHVEATEDPFTVFWTGLDLAAFQARHAETLEVLQPCRSLPPETETLALCASPACGREATRTAPIVAVIDDGIGFLNMRFCRRDRRKGAAARYRTRFHAIWLQAFRSVPAPAFGAAYVQAGEVLHRPEIDAILAHGPRLEESAAYRQLNLQLYEPGAHRSTEYGFSHGTHVLDLAAGADPESDDPALDWPLLAVQLPPEAVDNTAGTQLEPCIVEGVRWILRQALRVNGQSPVVINISFATFAGPKDGTKAIEALVAQMAERWQARHGRTVRVVYAWGNSRLHNQGAHLTLAPGTAEPVTWRLQPDDFAASFLELRPGNPTDMARLSVTLTPPGPGAMPQGLGPIPPNMSRPILGPDGRSVGRFYHLGPRVTAPGVVTPAHAVIAMAPSAGEAGTALIRPGAWVVTVAAQSGGPLPLRLEVQRGDTPSGYRLNGRQSYLDDPRAYDYDPESAGWTRPGSDCPITRQASHSSFVTARSDCTYAVAAARDMPGLPPSRYSATGAAWTRPEPSLSGIGDRGTALLGMVATGTASGSGRVSNGTSVAAARVSRALATAMDEGRFPPMPGEAERLALVAMFGETGDPALADRQGAGILTAPATTTVHADT
ncbi:MAG: hypothetical protein ACK4GW_04660 [Pseudorhodobacter sp.]